jgi:uncharacterized membrane protein
MAQHDDAHLDEDKRRKRIRRTTIVFALVALAFYIGFIVMMLMRGSK